MVQVPDCLWIEDERLTACLDSVEIAVQDLWKEPLLQNCTDHTPAHSARIVNVLGRLLRNYGPKLNENERFILLASAYLHDIGMQSPVHAGLEKKSRYSEDEEKQIRENHNEASAKMIADSLSSRSELKLGLENCARIADLIAQVCRYHRSLNLNELGDCPFSGDTIRIPLLTGLLRLGDELDADFNRVFMEVLKVRDIPPASKYHWWAHHYVRSVDIDENEHITLFFEFPLKHKGTSLIEALREKVIGSINRQYQEIYDLFESYGFRLYKDIKYEEVYSEIGLEPIPKDLESYLNQNIIKISKNSEDLTKKTGVNFYIDGIAFSDDIQVVRCLDRITKLLIREQVRDALKEIERCRCLTMGPKERGIFCIAAGVSYYISGDHQKSKSYFDDALAISRREDMRTILKVESERIEANALGNIGLIYQVKGDLDRGLKYHQDALKIHREIGFKDGEASDLSNIGVIYRDLGNLDQALKYLQDALEINKEIGFKGSEANDLGNIGVIYQYKGSLEKALKYLEDALKINKEIDFKQGEAKQLGNIGVIYQAKGDHDRALEYYQNALKINKEVGFKQGEANDLGNIGLIYQYKGDLDEALKHLQEALKINRKLGIKKGEANDLGNTGLVYLSKGMDERSLTCRNKGDLDKALQYFHDALKIDKEIGFRKGEANRLGNIGLIYLVNKDLDQALKYLQDALEINKEIGFKEGEAYDLGNIGVIHRHSGNLDEALKYFKEASKIDRENGFKGHEVMDLRNIGAIYRAKGDLQMAKDYFEKAQKIL